MRRGEAAILDAITSLGTSVGTRLDRIEARLDTLIDAVAELRHEYDTHGHPEVQ